MQKQNIQAICCHLHKHDHNSEAYWHFLNTGSKDSSYTKLKLTDLLEGWFRKGNFSKLLATSCLFKLLYFKVRA